MSKIVFFGRSDGGQDHLNKRFPCTTRKIYSLQLHVEIVPVAALTPDEQTK
jgi:hypothetical protein